MTRRNAAVRESIAFWSRGGSIDQAGTWGSSATKKLYRCRHTKRAQAGCSTTMSMMSSPLNRPRVAEKLFLAVVVIFRAVLELPREPPIGQARDLGLEGPAGEGAGRFTDILLRCRRRRPG